MAEKESKPAAAPAAKSVAPVAPAEKPAEAKPKKASEGKHKRKPGESTNKYAKYIISGDKLEKKRTCPKCGPTVFMGEHKDRFACGKCGYSEFKK
jgi:small subunit ribosomal protein S27Ae